MTALKVASEISPHEITLAYLERDSEAWVKLRDRCERAHWLDGGLSMQAEAARQRVDYLLEEYMGHLMLRDNPDGAA